MTKFCIYCGWQRTMKPYRDNTRKAVVCNECKEDKEEVFTKPVTPRPPTPQ